MSLIDTDCQLNLTNAIKINSKNSLSRFSYTIQINSNMRKECEFK